MRIYFYCFGFILIALMSPGTLFSQMEIVLPVLGVERSEVSINDREAADKLFQQAQAAAEAKNGGEVLRLTIAALELNPDHEGLRNLFGYQFHDNGWYNTWEIARLKRGYIDHPKFGWIPKKDVKRYEGGERFVSGVGWVDATDAAILCSDIRSGWIVAGGYYDLKTSHSLEEGVETVRRLDHLRRVWTMLFLNFLYGEDELIAALRGKPLRTMTTRYQAFLYRNKEDYVARLREIEPRIAASNGYYLPKTKRAYFFPPSGDMDRHDRDTVRKTIYHEGTHQLFHETRSSRVDPGLRNNFWIVEGIAMFMETFRIENRNGKRCYIVGDITDSRLDAAEFHKTDEGFYIPFDRLVAYGVKDFLKHPQLSKLYSQSAAMTQFLLLDGEGRNRDRVVRLLGLVYDGRCRPDSLSSLTGLSCKELDDGYVDFLRLVPNAGN